MMKSSSYWWIIAVLTAAVHSSPTAQGKDLCEFVSSHFSDYVQIGVLCGWIFHAEVWTIHIKLKFFLSISELHTTPLHWIP